MKAVKLKEDCKRMAQEHVVELREVQGNYNRNCDMYKQRVFSLLQALNAAHVPWPEVPCDYKPPSFESEHQHALTIPPITEQDPGQRTPLH